jgi:hypothetical protein
MIYSLYGLERSTMVEVFKTNVQERLQAESLVAVLLQQFPLYRINFDLHDCDKILRVEGEDIPQHSIIRAIAERGYQCVVLE